MAEWLKTDPENGMLIGPDGCHHYNEHQAAHYGLLHLCGCGDPAAAYNFCRNTLACFDRRGTGRDSPWLNAETLLEKLILSRPGEAAHVLAHLLTHLDLLEHGGNVGGSWPTKDGERIIDMSPMTEALICADDIRAPQKEEETA